VGPNGSGKTTLFQIATGKLKPDSGDVVRSKGTILSLFQQIPDFLPDRSILDTALSENKLYSEYSTRIHAIHAKMELVESDSPEWDKLIEAQSEAEEFANSHDLHNLETRAKKILTGLGFSPDALERPVRSFSPGFQHRLGLAIALLNPHNLILLDEPTNHLDDAAKAWLADYLISQPASYVLVTHDPEFLNQTTRSITEINSKGVFEFEGSLEEFFEAKNEIQERLTKQFEKEESYLKSRMEWVERFKAKATKARQAQSVLKRLEKREKLDRPDEIFWNQKPEYNFRYEEASKISFRITGGSFGYPDTGKQIFKDADLEVNNGDKVAIVGPNGAGKSTLMRCIAGIHPFLSGEFMIGPRTRFGYFSQTHSEDLNPDKSMLETVLAFFPHLPEVEARSLLGHFAFPGDTVFKQVKSLSGGEQSRLRLALLVHSPTNCLLLDEPTNHLDIVVRDALKRALQDYKGSVVVISHDPEFLSNLCNRTFRVVNSEVKNLNCSFSDYLIYHKEDSEEAGLLSISPKKSGDSIKKSGDSIKKSGDSIKKSGDSIKKSGDSIKKSGDSMAKSGNLDGDSDQLSKSERNQIKNKIKSWEKEIVEIESKLDRLEKNKKDKEELLGDPSFFKNRSYQSELDTYNEIKNEIALLTERWESVSQDLEFAKERLGR
jgi:ATP-binding cassette subfamily F protein 3